MPAPGAGRVARCSAAARRRARGHPRSRRRSSQRYPATAAGTSRSDEQERAKKLTVRAPRRRKPVSGRSQSPSVVSATCRAPAEASSAATSRRSSAAAAANCSRRRALEVSTRAGGRSRDRRGAARPTSAAPARAGRGPRRRATAWRPASRSSGGRQSRGPRKSETTTTRARCRATPVGALERLAAACALPRRRQLCAAARAACRAAPRRPWPRALDARLGSERDEAEAVAAARRRVADRERDALGDIGLAPVAPCRTTSRPRRRARARSRARARRAGRARAACPCGPSRSNRSGGRRRPARRAGSARARCRARERRAVVSGQQAVDAARDREVERAQQRLRQRAGPGWSGSARGGAGPAISRRVPAEVELRHRHGGQDLVEHPVGRAARRAPGRRAPAGGAARR